MGHAATGSASPTACLLRGCRRAGTQNEHLVESGSTVRGKCPTRVGAHGHTRAVYNSRPYPCRVQQSSVSATSACRRPARASSHRPQASFAAGRGPSAFRRRHAPRSFFRRRQAPRSFFRLGHAPIFFSKKRPSSTVAAPEHPPTVRVGAEPGSGPRKVTRLAAARKLARPPAERATERQRNATRRPTPAPQRSAVQRNGMRCHATACHDTPRHDTTRHATPRNTSREIQRSMRQPRAAQHSTAQHSTTKHSTAQRHRAPGQDTPHIALPQARAVPRRTRTLARTYAKRMSPAPPGPEPSFLWQ